MTDGGGRLRGGLAGIRTRRPGERSQERSGTAVPISFANPQYLALLLLVPLVVVLGRRSLADSTGPGGVWR